MKRIGSFSVIALCFLSLNSFAVTKGVSVQCALNEDSELSATVAAGRKVTVFAPNYVNGYAWTSLDGIKGKIVKPAELEGTYQTAFSIDTSKQREVTKTYVFRSARSFDPNARTWDCSVTVNLK